MQVVAVTINFAASALAEADLILNSLSLLPLDALRGEPFQKDC